MTFAPYIVVLLEKSIPVQRHTNGKFMLVWKNNMLFSGKMTIVDEGILSSDVWRENFHFYEGKHAPFK
jgi:hypothetical protein